MRYLFLLIFFTISTFGGFAKQNSERIHLTLALNPGDCNTCLRELYLIDSISRSGNYLLSIVFESVYKKDSIDLIKNFFLEDYTEYILFNDSIYQEYYLRNSQQESSFTISTKYSEKAISMPFSLLSRSYKYLNALNNNVDTINFEEPVLGSTKRMKITEDKFYVLNKLKNEIFAYDKIGLHKERIFSLTDSIALEGYKVKFGQKVYLRKCNESEGYIRKNKLIGENTKIIGYDLCNDTLFVLLNQPNLIKNTSPRPGEEHVDSVIVNFYTLVTVHNYKIINMSNIETYNDGEYVDKPGLRRKSKNDNKYDAYFLYENFIIRGDKLYIDLISQYISEDEPNWAIAMFRKKAGRYVFDKYQEALPNFYVRNRLGYNNTGMLENYKDYYSFYLSNTLYNFEDKNKNIDLDFVPRDTLLQFIVDYKIIDSTLYILTNPKKNLEQIDTRYVLYKYDLSTKKVIDKKTLEAGRLKDCYQFPVVDPFDYRYIYYFISESKIVRYKLY